MTQPTRYYIGDRITTDAEEVKALRSLPQPAQPPGGTPTLEDALRFARVIEAAYERGYADAVRFVEAEAAQRNRTKP